jgi:uncharacterized protein YegP (UPF0339 family)
MAGKYHLKVAKDGQFHFNLAAGNGETILSSELYKAKASALNGIESVRKNAQRDGAFEVKAANGGKFHFVLKASNGQTVGQSELYTSEASAKAGTESVKKNAPDAILHDHSAA